MLEISEPPLDYATLICYSTQSGTSEKLAFKFSQFINQHIELSNLSIVKNVSEIKSINYLKKFKLVIFFISTYGEGEPCDDGIEFYNWLKAENSINSLNSVNYSLFGCGSSLYDDYQEAAIIFDNQLKRLGANRIGNFGKGDDGKGMIVDDFNDWLFDYIFKFSLFLNLNYNLDNHTYLPSFNIYEIDEDEHSTNNKPAYSPPYHEFNPYFANVPLDKIEKFGDDYLHVTIELDKLKTKLNYQTGDHVGIFPINSVAQVNLFLKTFGLYNKKDKLVKIFPVDRISTKLWFENPITYKNFITKHLEINSPLNRKLIRDIASYFITNNEQIKNLLLEITKNKEIFQAEIINKKITLVNLLSKLDYNWDSIPFSFLIENFGKINTRFFSISSSNLKEPNFIDITVKLINEEIFQGVFSRNIIDLCNDKIKNELPIYIKKSKFKLPYDLKKPIILICAGSGIAPFRGFIRDLCEKSSNSFNKVILYYGVRNLNDAFLYKDEWPQYEKILKEKFELKLAISRPDNGLEKEYVQDKILKDKEIIGDLIVNQKGYIYICGDANGMSKSVNKLLLDIISGMKGSIKEGDKVLKYMKSMGKFKEDVW